MPLPSLGRLSVCATGAPGDGDGHAAQRDALSTPDIIAKILTNLDMGDRGAPEIEKLACEAARSWCNLNSVNKAACAPDTYWKDLTANVFPYGRAKPNIKELTHRSWFFELCRRYRFYRKVLSALGRADDAVEAAKQRIELEESAYAAALQDIADQERKRMEPYDERWSAYFKDMPPQPVSPWYSGAPKPPRYQAYDDWWDKKMRNHEYPPYHPKHEDFSVARNPHQPGGDRYYPAWDYNNGLLRREEERIRNLVARRRESLQEKVLEARKAQERAQASANYTVRLLRWAKNQMSNNQHKDEYPRPPPHSVHFPHSGYIRPKKADLSDDSDDEGNKPPPTLPHGTNPFDLEGDEDDADSSSSE